MIATISTRYIGPGWCRSKSVPRPAKSWRLSSFLSVTAVNAGHLGHWMRREPFLGAGWYWEREQKQAPRSERSRHGFSSRWGAGTLTLSGPSTGHLRSPFTTSERDGFTTRHWQRSWFRKSHCACGAELPCSIRREGPRARGSLESPATWRRISAAPGLELPCPSGNLLGRPRSRGTRTPRCVSGKLPKRSRRCRSNAGRCFSSRTCISSRNQRSRRLSDYPSAQSRRACIRACGNCAPC